ncbi:MAG: methylenetetrahydrofolate reductase [Actinomycetes bacterium]|jgi:methylenetetrahydrofolate reductase (NADPH)|nr:methylenetetrahydrofolate reductase [Actinomycetes bacterium]
MKTTNLFMQGPVFSIEVYPVKKNAPIEVVYRAVDALAGLAPDFISVTYGAGGGAVTSAATVEIASLVKNTYGIEAVAHIRGIDLTAPEVDSLLGRLRRHNIENVLALRGDVLPGMEQTGEFNHASDLASYIHAECGDEFNVLGAAYPEVHTEAADAESDLAMLALKVRSGVSHLLTQLFFDNDAYFRFLERVRAAGIDVPIQPGIMPIVNARQVERMVQLSGCSQPPAFRAMIERYGDDDASLRAAGIEYAIEQCRDLLARGADGIHLYPMNDPDTASAILSAIR